MDPDLLRGYEDELAYLREVGAEFARDFPNVARQLDLHATDVPDPYVERLLEGFAFLAARIRIKLDAEYPRFIQHLLETVYPNFVAPVPSMAVLRFQPDLGDPNLARGSLLARGAAVQGRPPDGPGGDCEFRTAHDVCLWPIEIAGVQYASHVPDLPVGALPCAREVAGALRVRLRLHGGLRFDALPLDTLPLYIAAPRPTAMRLHELVLGAALGTWVIGPGTDGAGARSQWRGAGSVRPLGFDAEHALLPETLRGFSGHRLVQEYAAMPQRLLFFAFDDLAARLARVPSSEAELVILFSRGDVALESLVDAGSLALFCTPAINLFHKRLGPIDITDGRFEHHVVPDRTRPLDFEVHSLDSVVAHGIGRIAMRRFTPLYAAGHGSPSGGHGYYTVRREPRAAPELTPQDAPRPAAPGNELFVSLVDPGHAPIDDELRQLSLTGWVTNRDLPLRLRSAASWQLDGAAPVRRVDCLHGPTAPVQRLPRGETGWALVSLLALNHLAIAGVDGEQAAAALRSMLALFGPGGDGSWQRLVGGLRAVRARSVTRRLPGRGPLTVASGIEVQLEVDERAFEGNSAFMFGSVMERYLARHATVNHCTETTLHSTTRGPVMRWPARHGSAMVL